MHDNDSGERRNEADAERISSEIAGSDLGTDPFVAAVRATRMPMIITNPRLPDNPVVFANNSFCRLTGYDRDEILNRNCRFLQGPETDPETVRLIRKAVDNAVPIEIDIRNHRKDGEPFWNRLLMAPVLDTEGKLAYFFASQVDVTLERERLEGLESDNASLMAELTGRLRDQMDREQELSFAMRTGRFGTWSYDFSTGEQSASATCKEIFGRDAALPFTFEDRLAAIVPDDRADVEAAMQRTRTLGQDFDTTCRIVTPSGQQRWMVSRGQAFLDSNGKPLRVTGVSFDITAQKRGEQLKAALLELGDIFRDLDDPVDLSFAAAELIGRTLDVSRAGYGVIDRERETITIERDWNAPGIQTIAGTLGFRDYGTYIEDLKRGETAIVADARLDPRTRDTADALEAISARSFVNMPLTERGGLVALLYTNHEAAREWLPDEVAFMRDVAERTREATERRRAQLALAQLNTNLEQQIADRTSELLSAEEALRQSQKMEAVGQLTGGLAHDFNNLLQGIGGSLELIKTRISQGRYSEVDKFVSAAQAASRRAAALTHRLLAFSRRQTLDPRHTDVNRLIAGLDDLIRRTVGPQVEIELVGAGGLWTTLVDPNQLENALLNLCINARDAMPDGGRITIETANKWLDERAAAERELPPGQYISLCVSDTGTGMSPEVASRAFDPFFTTKPLGQGTGLGLSMIYGFARQSGGQVRIYSELGQGTTMCIYLPRSSGQAVDVSDPAPAALMKPEHGSGEVVLIVDDEAPIRMLIGEVLDSFGYASIEAADGPSGLAILRSSARIDLLITDVGLPGGMNGRQVADAARALRPDLKVLFITGYAENAAVGNGHLDAGMEVLTKPFAVDDLAQRVRTMIRQG